MAERAGRQGVALHYLSVIMFDLVIIGGGPGGVAAGVYAARKKIKTVLTEIKITKSKFPLLPEKGKI